MSVTVTKRPRRTLGGGGARRNAPQFYYQEWCPLGELAEWYENEDLPLEETEFCIFNASQRVVDRHFHANDAAALREGLVTHNCMRFEVGPSTHTGARRLVYDLDMDDYHCVYPGARLPTKERGLDELAWSVVRLSTRLLDAHLVLAMFGPEQAPPTLAVFSGRRGVHLWVMGNVQVDWLTTDSVQQHLDALDALQTPAGAKTFAALLARHDAAGSAPAHLHLAELRQALRIYAQTHLMQPALWNNAGDASARRDLFSRVLACHPRRADLTVYSIRSADIAAFFRELPTNELFWERAGILLLAPRPDRPVSLQPTHLIKAPFSLHQATQQVSLPFDPHDPGSAALESVIVRVKDLIDGRPPSVEAFARGVTWLKTQKNE